MSGDVTKEGDVEIDMRKLLAVIRAMGKVDLTPTMAIVAEMLVADVQDEFQTEGHGKWEPLSESTIAKRRGKTFKILQDTGRFAASVQPVSGSDFAEASTDVSYAIFHCSTAPRSIIPYRNPFELPDDALERVNDVLLKALIDGIPDGK